MLAIRMQRTGRKGHAEFRIIVQESRRTPTSGAIVTQLGHYNPHAKTVVLDKEKTSFYLEHGAQPSESVVRLLQKESIKLPSWVKLATTKSRTTRHPEKLRANQPAKPAAEVETTEATNTPDGDADTETNTDVAGTEPVSDNEASAGDETLDVVVAESVTDQPVAKETSTESEKGDGVADEAPVKE